MRVTHASQAQDGKRLTYHGISHPRWSTPAAPMFDATSMPRKNTYRPTASPLHSADLAVAERQKDERKEVRKANKVFHRSQAKINPRAVILRKQDGSVAGLTFKHADAVTITRVVPTHKPLSKKVDIDSETLTKIRATAIESKPVGSDLLGHRTESGLIHSVATSTTPTMAERLARFRR